MVAIDNKDIKIPTHHYVGFNKRGDDEIPLGFMTPDGTDQAAVKRKATVDSWASSNLRRYNYQTQTHYTVEGLPSQTYENKPLSGFKFGRSVRHGGSWGQGTTKWRIEDPRGFELEISSNNLQQIMEITTIECGEILEKCVWGRLKNENILIPVTAEVYKTAQANTERMGKTASIKDLEIGHYVILQNGVEGIYMGAHYEITRSYRYTVDQSSKKKHQIVEIDDNGVPKQWHDFASLKLAEIRPGTKIYTIVEAEDELCRLAEVYNKSVGYSSKLAFSHKPIKDISYFTQPFDLTKWKQTKNRRDYAMVQLDQEWGHVDLTYIGSYNTPTNSRLPAATMIDRDRWLRGDGWHQLTDPRGGFYRGYHYTREFNQHDPSLVWETMHATFKRANGQEIRIDY